MRREPCEVLQDCACAARDSIYRGKQRERACAGKGVLWPGRAHAWGSRPSPPHEAAAKGPSSARFETFSRNTCGPEPMTLRSFHVAI